MSKFVKKILLLAALVLGLGATAHPALAGEDTEATQTETHEATEAEAPDEGTQAQPSDEGAEAAQPADDDPAPQPGDTTPSEE